MSILKYFKNTPSRPHRATCPKCNFFLQICNEVPGGKKRACRPLGERQGPVAHPSGPSGDRGLSPVGGATGPPFFQGLILSYSSVYSSSSSAGSRPLTPTTPNLSFIKSREKSQELPLFHEHYGTHEHNKFTSIISIETNDK